MSVQAAAAGRRSGRRFYVGVAIVMALTVFLGFAPTFYLKAYTAAPPLSPLVWIHGGLFSSWLVLLVAQTMLAAIGRTDLHMRLGQLGTLIAIAMVIIGLQTAITAARLGHTPPGGPPSLQFLAIPFFSIVEFAVLFAAAIVLRANRQAHKRLMLLATVAILSAAVARLPLAIVQIPPVFFALTDLFILAGVLHDWRAHGRVHPVYVWVGSLFVILQPLQLALMGTGPWLAFASWLTR